MKEKYGSVMENNIAINHAELASPESVNVSGWYLPHHPVFHPRSQAISV